MSKDKSTTRFDFYIFWEAAIAFCLSYIAIIFDIYKSEFFTSLNSFQFLAALVWITLILSIHQHLIGNVTENSKSKRVNLRERKGAVTIAMISLTITGLMVFNMLDDIYGISKLKFVTPSCCLLFFMISASMPVRFIKFKLEDNREKRNQLFSSVGFNEK